MYICLHVNYPLLLFDFNENLNLLDRVSKNIQISNFMKIRPVGAELFDAGGRTDTTKLIVAFRNCANATKKSSPTPRSPLPTIKSWGSRELFPTHRTRTHQPRRATLVAPPDRLYLPSCPHDLLPANVCRHRHSTPGAAAVSRHCAIKRNTSAIESNLSRFLNLA